MRNFVVMDGRWRARDAFFFSLSFCVGVAQAACAFALSGYCADVKKCLAKGEQQFYLHSS